MFKIILQAQESIKKIREFLLELFFPFTCVSCQQKSQKWLCPTCLQTLTLSYRCELCLCLLEEEKSRCSRCENRNVRGGKEQTLFEKEKTIQSIVQKMAYPSFYPLIEVIASYTLLAIDRVEWPTFSKVISLEKKYHSLAKEIDRRQKNKRSKEGPLLVVVEKLPREKIEEGKKIIMFQNGKGGYPRGLLGIIKRGTHFFYSEARREVYTIGIFFDQDSK